MQLRAEGIGWCPSSAESCPLQLCRERFFVAGLFGIGCSLGRLHAKLMRLGSFGGRVVFARVRTEPPELLQAWQISFVRLFDLSWH